MRNVEILAPVGNMESLKSAINNNADAIYLGAKSFNARGGVENFSFESLKEAVEYAHLFGVKVYLTLNTLIKDEEMKEVLNVVEKALEICVDAFIVQDVGLVYLIKNTFPNAVIHASTQMGVNNLEGAKFLSEAGFTRIVLARETPLEEVRRIHENLDVELEYFVQGALCVSFSGNCYLCSLLAGKSGNRGECKQFCRLPFKLLNKEEYFLSAKDFCLLKRLKDLKDAGVISFKIEGRARRASFVGGATKIYKDAVLNDFNYDEKEIITLKKLFNRGNFIEGYFGDEKKIYSKTQNHIGVSVGRVGKVKLGKKFNEIFILSNEDIVKGDGLKFFDKGKEVASVGVMDVKKEGKFFVLTTTQKISAGLTVNKILDAKLEEEILSRKRQIKVDAKFVAKIGQKAKLTLKHEDVVAEVESESVLSEAKTSPLTQEEIQDNLTKLGEFCVENLSVEMDKVFLRKAELNALRREIQEKLKAKILEGYNLKNIKKQEKINKKVQIFDKKSKKVDIFEFSDLKTLKKFKDSDAILVYKFSDFNADEILKTANEIGKIIYLDLPLIATYEDLSKIKEILKHEKIGVVANNYYALNLTAKERTIVGVNLNIFNSYAVKFYAELGFNKIVLTQEDVKLENFKNCGVSLFAVSEYFPEYMFFKHCPIKEHIGGDCGHCKYKPLVYEFGKYKFNVIRRKIASCQFVLKDSVKRKKMLPRDLNKVIEFENV